jgi:chromosome segregation ATPase
MPIAREIRERLGKVFDEAQAAVLSEVITEAYNELVKVSDFNELKAIVKELTEAQVASEKRLTRIEIAVEALTEAQKRTEARVEELAEAQKRTEARVEELAEAQKRTEARVEELAEAQKRTEARVEELAEAQKRTEQELQKLIQEHSKTREQVGGLSNTIGYILENEAYKALPRLLKEDYGITIKDRLKRQYVTDNRGKPIELNIIGEASRDGEKIVIVGESKSQLSRKGVDEFIKKKLSKVEGVYKEIFPLLVTHMISGPDVEEYVKKKGIALFYSYDF